MMPLVVHMEHHTDHIMYNDAVNQINTYKQVVRLVCYVSEELQTVIFIDHTSGKYLATFLLIREQIPNYLLCSSLFV